MSLIPKKGTVYVVDDDEAVRDSLQWLLEGKDYRVRCFDSAETFLSRYDPREVACLIVDIRMGGMTGLELQDRLIERKSPLPIVFITGHGDVPMAVNTMKKGAMDFIQKPFKEDDLVGLVERMLDRAKDTFAEYQNQASRDALLSKLTSREAKVLERIDPEVFVPPTSDGQVETLSPKEIEQLPDDPEELAVAIEALAGVGAEIRVNGFEGGSLPPKNQIQVVRIRKDPFSTDSMGAGQVRLRVTASDGQVREDTLPGVRDDQGFDGAAQFD